MAKEQEKRSGAIPARAGLDVYVNTADQITIRQVERHSPMDDDAMVVVHPDDVDKLCELLQQVKREALEGQAGEG